MSLKAILEEIRARGETQILDIEKHTQTRVDQILEGARQRAGQIRQEVAEEVAAPAREEHAHAINRSNLQALRIIDQARQDSIEDCLAAIRDRLGVVREKDFYPDVFAQLVGETLSEIRSKAEGDGRVRLQIDSRDQSLLEDVLEDESEDLDIGYDLETWGGLIAYSEDGRVVVYNTLESRLERATPYIQRYLAARFSEQG